MDKTFFEVSIESTTNEDTNYLESLFSQDLRGILSLDDSSIEEPCDFPERLGLIPDDIEIDYVSEKCRVVTMFGTTEESVEQLEEFIKKRNLDSSLSLFSGKEIIDTKIEKIEFIFSELDDEF